MLVFLFVEIPTKFLFVMKEKKNTSLFISKSNYRKLEKR